MIEQNKICESELAYVLGLSRHDVRQLILGGVVSRNSKGSLMLANAMRSYVQHWRAEIKRHPRTLQELLEREFDAIDRSGPRARG